MTPFDPRLPLIASDARVKTCHVYHCWCAMRDAGRAFHVTAFAQFAGLEPRHVTAIIEAMAAHDALPDKRAKVSNRGFRIADDFKPPQDWIDWAVNERKWTPDDATEECEIFANYWQSKAGKDACKLDWRKTWQNWVRNSRRPDGDYRPSTGMVAPREHMERTAALYERMGRTVEAEQIRRDLAKSANVVPINRKIA